MAKLPSMLHKSGLALALFCGLPLIAQAPKEPWSLTVEERIALRTNPELARERVREHEREQERNRSRLQLKDAPANRALVVDGFTGRTHPELFLPHEVFVDLVLGAFRGDVRKCELFQKMTTNDVRRHALPADFWERLRVLSTVYVADERRLDDLFERRNAADGRNRDRVEQAIKLQHEEICRSRAEALEAARAEFGRARFDRFLYESLVVDKFYVATEKLPDAALLRRLAEGCR